MVKHYTTRAAIIAASALLAACSSESPTDPVANDEAVPQLIELTVGKTPTAMLEQIAGNYYPTFEIARGLGGDRAESWDEARFRSEIKAALAPHSAQIDAAFATHVAENMDEGEAKRLLDLLNADKNAEFAACAFNTDAGGSVNRMESCAQSVGITPSQVLQDALGSIARRMGDALQGEPVMDIALGYATCKVLADFGKEVSNDAFSLDLATTKVGIGETKRPCTEYDALAVARLTNDVQPNFPEAEAKAEAGAEAGTEAE